MHVCTNSSGKFRNLSTVRRLLTQGDAESMRDNDLDNPFHALWAEMANNDTYARLEGIAAFVEDCPESPIFQKIEEHEFLAADAVQNIIMGGAESLLSMGDNERGSVLSTARRNTKFIDSPAIGRATAESSFSLDELKSRKGGVSLYLCLPARLIATHSRFLRLVINLILYRMEAMGLSKPESGSSVLFVMDEFASLGHMEAIEKAAGLMAGYGVKLWPILQDLTQLKTHYKESWETFLGNAGILQFFGNTDLTTLEWIEKRAGQTQIIIETGGTSRSVADGTTEGTATTESKTSQKTAGVTESKSKMAPLSAMSARGGGSNIFEQISRGDASDLSLSSGTTTSESYSASNGESKNTGTTSSITEAVNLTKAAHLRPLCRLDEIAENFNREQGLQIVFIGGGRPLVLHRTPYDLDPQFSNFRFH